jgi:hypothetical protein
MIDDNLPAILDEIDADARIANDDKRSDFVRLEAGKRTTARTALLTTYVRLQRTMIDVNVDALAAATSEIERLREENKRLVDQAKKFNLDQIYGSLGLAVPVTSP